MGQTHSSADYFRDVSVKEHFCCIQTLWSEDDLARHIQSLKDVSLNFSLDKVKFVRLVQLSIEYEANVAQWFHDFTQDRACQVVDGLEFLSAAIMVSAKVHLYTKICLLFSLFDLDKTGSIRKDEFTIFLKSVTVGLHRMLSGFMPPSSVQELSAISAQFFATLPSGQAVSKQHFLMWMTQEPYSLRYLSVLSRLGSTIFAMGTNHRYQLGLHLEPRVQRMPAPLLHMEGIVITSIATHESHSLFLTKEGRIWSCGKGFCGLLGHGDTSDRLQPQLIEALAHVRVVDVAAGVRHSVAVSEKGQVFTWGAADLGQLGHGSTDDQEVHEVACDPKTGNDFAYITKPTVVMGLFGKKIHVRKVSCCNFTTSALTEQGNLYSWGNNTDGQCGQGQQCPHHRLIYMDPHMHRTAMQVITEPQMVQVGDDTKFRSISAGGYHVLAVDMQNRLWTWGQGLWGKLGHGDQQPAYEPRLVEALKHHICQATAAGESHSACLCAMYRITLTGSFDNVCYLGLPAGRVDRQMERQKPVTPPNTKLQLHAFASARLLQAGLPFHYYPGHSIFDPQQHSPVDVQNSIVLMSRSLWKGEWLKLSTSDFDFNVKMSSSATPLVSSQPMRGPIVVLSESFELGDCTDKICIFELRHSLAQAPPGELHEAILEVASKCARGSGRACICILPKQVSEFDVGVPEQIRATLSSLPVGVMGNKHGHKLLKHMEQLQTQDDTGAQAALVTLKDDCFLQWLKDVVATQPKGIIISQTSWCPDPELLDLPQSLFNLDTLDIPIVLVSFEVGEELRNKTTSGHDAWVTMEFQQTGAIYAWGNGSKGQLGLAAIENRTFLQASQNALTGEENAFVDRPCYVAHLHEHQLTEIACGVSHTVAVTASGEVFSWGAADALGVPVSEPCSEVPLMVGQFEGLAKASKPFAGHHHTFVLADMPFKSVV